MLWLTEKIDQMSKQFLQVKLHLTSPRFTSLRCGCLPLAAGLCRVTASAAVHVQFCLVDITLRISHIRDFLLMNVGADAQKLTKCFCCFLKNAKWQWVWWERNVICDGPTTMQHQWHNHQVRVVMNNCFALAYGYIVQGNPF